MTTANVNITKVLMKRGNTAQNAAYTGVNGEITVDTQLKTLRIHDGVTVGGNAITATGAIGSYSNTNTAAYLASQSITSANIGSFQTYANANAVTQTTEINSLRANITAANAAITALQSNAAVQAAVLDTLTGNAATQSQVLDTLTANAAAQSTTLTTLLSNAVAQQTSLIDLVANAAVQAQAIANVSGTYSNTNVSAYLSTFSGNVSAGNVITNNFLYANGLPYVNAGVQASYYRGYRPTQQTTPSVGTVVAFYSTESSTGNDISLDTNNGNITLQPNKTYRIRGTVGSIATSLGGATIGYQWYNATSSQYLGNSAVIVSDESNASYALAGGTTETIFTPSITTNVQLRISSINGTVNFLGVPNIGSPWFDIEVIGGYLPLVLSYSNANVKSYLSAFDGNILPSANVTYSLGDATHQWKDLWVSNNTIYIGNTPVRVDGGTLLVNNAPVSSNTGSLTFNDRNVESGGLPITFESPIFTVGDLTVQPPATGSNGRTRIFLKNESQSDVLTIESISTYDPDTNRVRIWADPGANEAVRKNILIGTDGGDVQLRSTGDNAATFTWTFDRFGNLVLPNLGNINYANGVNILSTITGSGTYGNANVATYLSRGNVTVGNITIQDEYDQQWRFSNGALIWPAGDGTPTGPSIDGSSNMLVTLMQGGDFEIYTTQDITGNTRSWTFNSVGNLLVPDDATIHSDLDLRLYADTGNIALGNQNGTWMFDNDGRFTAPGDVYGQYFTLRGGNGPGAEIGSLGYGGNVVTVYGFEGFNIETGAVESGPQWQFNTEGNLTLPGNLILPSLGMIEHTTGTSQLLLSENGFRFESNVGTNSTYIDGQQNALFLLGGTDGTVVGAGPSTWNFDAAGNLTLSTTGNIVNGGNVWTFGSDGNLTLPGIQNPASRAGTILNVKGIVGTTASSGANISGFSFISAATIRAGSYQYSNGISILDGISGTYGNTEVAAYLNGGFNIDGPINFTASPPAYSSPGIQWASGWQGDIYGNTQVASYLTAQNITSANIGAYQTWANVTFSTSAGANYSNANVVANLQNFVTSISTTANVTTTANVIAPNFLFANGVNILSTVSGGGSSYANADAAAYLAANSAIYLGNPVTRPLLQANNTQVFVGNATTIAQGGASSLSSTFIMNNAYYNTAGVLTARNTSASGSAQFEIAGGTFNWNAASSATAGSAAGMGARMTLNSSGLATQNSIGITSAGTLTVQGASGLVTTQSTGALFNTTATTINLGGAATTINMGAATVAVSVGSGTGSLTIGSVNTTNIYTSNAVIAGGYISGTANIAITSAGNISGVGNIIGATSNTTITAGTYVTSFLNNGMVAIGGNLTVSGNNNNVVTKSSFIGPTGTATTLDNISANWSGGPAQFQIATVSGSILAHWNTQTSFNGTFTVSSNNGTLTTSPTNAGGTAATAGDAITVLLTDITNGRFYRITGHIGPSYLNSPVIIERVV